MENKKLGDYLRNLREMEGLSMNQVAKAAGMSQGYLSRIESGTGNPPSAEILQKLATVLKVHPTLLMIQAGYIDETALNQKHVYEEKDNELYHIFKKDELFFNGFHLTKREQNQAWTMLKLFFREKEQGKYFTTIRPEKGDE